MKIKIIATTDIHGSILPTNYISRDNIEDIGLARIETAIKQYRKKDNVLLIDNGDSFQGSPLTSYAIEKNMIIPISKVFNYLDYDYINLGNHDFNYGEEVLLNYIKHNNATLLTSNIEYKNKPLGSTQIIEKENNKIAIIGVCTHYIPNWEHPSNIVNMTFKDAYTALKNEVHKVIGDVDFIIGVYHGGLEKDPNTGKNTEKQTGENQGYQMCDIKGLNLLITGHQHRSLVERINGVLVTQTTFKAKEFVEIDIDLDSKESQAKIIDVKDFKPDNNVLADLKDIEDKTQEWLDQPVGVIKKYDLKIKDGFDARLNKHPLISFLNQVQLDISKADISASSLFNGVIGFNEEITMRDLVNTYIFPNTLVVKEISGKSLKAAIEVSLGYFDLDNNNQLKVSDTFVKPKPQHYNYDMFDGVEYTAKISNPVGKRLTKITFKNQPIIDSQMYTLVVNDYRAMGAGNYDMIANAETVKEIQIEMTEIIKNYLKANSPVTINHKNNINITV